MILEGKVIGVREENYGKRKQVISILVEDVDNLMVIWNQEVIIKSKNEIFISK